MRFTEAALKPRPEYTPELLKQTMRIYTDWHRSLMPYKLKSSENSDADNKTKSKRNKSIIIEDSNSNFFGRNAKKSDIVTSRNPFKKDEQLFDYEMDSEDEWAERNGEDIDKKDVEEEQEDEEMANEEEEEEGFIVSDGHLSVCEYDFSQDDTNDENKLKEIALRRERVKQERMQAENSNKQSYCIVQDSTQECMDQLNSYRVVSFGSHMFPLCVKKPEKIYDLGQGDPNAILRFRAQLIKACYSSLESKQQIIDDFNDKYPECSKKSIERVFKEIIVKEKRDGDLRPAWYATDAIISELSVNTEELMILAKERMRPLVEEADAAEQARLEEIKIKEELRRLEKAQKDAERERKERERQLEKDNLAKQREAERLEREALREAERKAKEEEKQRERESKERQRLEEQK